MNKRIQIPTPRAWYADAAVPGALFVLVLTLSNPALCALAPWTVGHTASTQALASPDPHRSSSAKTRSTPVKTEASSKSAWKDLTAAQQQALKPLAERWGGLSEERKRKWLALSRNYASMAPAEQAKLQSRMSEWVSLSQQQRTQARLNFAETKKLSPEQKAQQWQAYQALSPEEKKKLAAKAPSNTAGVAIVKPATSQKLVDVPVSRHTQIKGARLAAAKYPVQENTLLPQQLSPQSASEAGSESTSGSEAEATQQQ